MTSCTVGGLGAGPQGCHRSRAAIFPVPIRVPASSSSSPSPSPLTSLTQVLRVHDEAREAIYEPFGRPRGPSVPQGMFRDKEDPFEVPPVPTSGGGSASRVGRCRATGTRDRSAVIGNCGHGAWV